MKEYFGIAKDFISIIIIAFILAMLIRTFIIEPRMVPTESMVPTIKIGDRLLVSKFIYYFKEPARGDIIVFKPPASLDAKYDYVKRVIGLPGDKVEIKDNMLYINGQKMKEPYVKEPMNGHFGPVTVPADSLLVLGDNRNNSLDSRYWSEWLKRDHVIGKAFCIYWPIGNQSLLERQISLVTSAWVWVTQECSELVNT